MGIGVLSVCKSNRPEDRIIQRRLLISWVQSEVAPVRYGLLKAEPTNSGLLVQHATGQLRHCMWTLKINWKKKRKAQDNDLEFLNACLF